jgi:phosphate transport system protein
MKKLDRELEAFRQRLIGMGNLAEKMVRQAAEALVDPRESNLGAAIIDEENRLDLMQLEIDREAIRLLTVYSPVASDLRMIMSISRITAELERIGDHTMNMCESLQLLVSRDQVDLPPAVLRMATVVSGMLRDALDAFAKDDITKAQSTIASDNIVDALNDQIIGDLLSMEIVRDVLAGARDMAAALGQLLIVRSLERIADQATNISEEVVYMVKGDDIRHQSLAIDRPDRT